MSITVLCISLVSSIIMVVVFFFSYLMQKGNGKNRDAGRETDH